MTPYTAYPDIQGIIYKDDMNRNRLMCTDELHKFSDGTLNHAHTALNDIATGIQMEYLPKRRWTNQDKRRARVMINVIDRKLRDRRLMRSLEKFVDPHRFEGINKDGNGDFRYSDIVRPSRSDEVLKLKNFEKDASLQLSSYQIKKALTTDDKREGPREEEQVFMDDLERLKRQEKEANEEAEVLRKKFEHLVIKEGAARTSSTNIFSTVSTPAKASSTNLVNTVSIPVSTASPHEGLSLSDPTNPEEDDSEIPPLEDIYQNSTDGIFTTSSYDDEGAVADFTNLETVVNVSPIPTSRIHSTHPKALILGDPNSAVQTRSKVNTSSGAHAFVSYVQKQKRTNHKDFQHCLFACFLSQHEPKKISEALEDESWVDAMQEELLKSRFIKFGLV
ncbi:hypothetical protein Tco_0247547 [Tanacetum coccineum]